MSAPRGVRFAHAFDAAEYSRRLEWVVADLDRIIARHPNTRLVVARAMLKVQAQDAACPDPWPSHPADLVEVRAELAEVVA